MEITYLKKLQENLNIGYSPCQPLPISEIENLEQTYNNGNPFPKVLRELLFLAGEDCMVLDYGAEDEDGLSTQVGLQEWIRTMFAFKGTPLFTRPFYVIEIWQGYVFSFIFLDEGDNPMIYDSVFSPDDAPLDWAPGTYYDNSNMTIPTLLSMRIDDVKAGRNPF